MSEWVREWMNGLAAFQTSIRERIKYWFAIWHSTAIPCSAGKLSADSSFTGYFCPCLWAYHNAMSRQSIKMTVISRTHNWTLILSDTVERMICQPDRAWVLTSADWLRTQVLVPGSDPRPSCRRTGMTQPLIRSSHLQYRWYLQNSLSMAEHVGLW